MVLEELEPSYNLSKNLWLLPWILKLIVDMEMIQPPWIVWLNAHLIQQEDCFRLRYIFFPTIFDKVKALNLPRCCPLVS